MNISRHATFLRNDCGRRVALFAAIFGILTFSYIWNGFGVVGPGHPTPLDQFSKTQVLLPSAAAGDLSLLHPMIVGNSSAPYLSQFGLHGIVYRGLVRLGSVDPAFVLVMVQPLLAVLFAGVLAALLVVMAPVLGSAASLSTGLALAFAPRLVLAASDPYWLAFLTLLPVLVAFHGYARILQGHGSMWRLVAAVGACAAAKFLTGYEFASVVALAPAMAVPFWEPVGRWLSWRALSRTMALASAAILGFGVAIILHFAQVQLVLGRDPFAHLMGTGAARAMATSYAAYVLSDIAPHAANRMLPILNDLCLLVSCDPTIIWQKMEQWRKEYFAAGVLIILSYFFTDMISFPSQSAPYAYLVVDGREILFVHVLAAQFFLLAVLLSTWRWIPDGAHVLRLGLVATLSLTPPLSWFVLGFGHSVIHGFIVPTALFFPWGILVIGFISTAALALLRLAIGRTCRPTASGA